MSISLASLGRIAALAAAIFLFSFSYLYVDEHATYKVMPAVIYFLAGMLFATGTRPFRVRSS